MFNAKLLAKTIKFANSDHTDYIELPKILIRDVIDRTNSELPIFFSIHPSSSRDRTLRVHGRFVDYSQDGCIGMPPWMLGTCGIEEGDMVDVNEIILSKIKYLSISPRDGRFAEILSGLDSFDEVLAQLLSRYATIGNGQIITLDMFDEIIELKIMKLKSDVGRTVRAGYILNLDVNVDIVSPSIEPHMTTSSINASIDHAETIDNPPQATHDPSDNPPQDISSPVSERQITSESNVNTLQDDEYERIRNKRLAMFDAH